MKGGRRRGRGRHLDGRPFLRQASSRRSRRCRSSTAIPGSMPRLLARKLKKIGVIGTRTVMESRLYGGIPGAELVAPEGATSSSSVHNAYVEMASIGQVTDAAAPAPSSTPAGGSAASAAPRRSCWAAPTCSWPSSGTRRRLPAGRLRRHPCRRDLSHIGRLNGSGAALQQVDARRIARHQRQALLEAAARGGGSRAGAARRCRTAAGRGSGPWRRARSGGLRWNTSKIVTGRVLPLTTTTSIGRMS